MGAFLTVENNLPPKEDNCAHMLLKAGRNAWMRQAAVAVPFLVFSSRFRAQQQKIGAQRKNLRYFILTHIILPV